MAVGKGFASGFGGCLGVGCAMVLVLVAIPVSCITIGGLAVHSAHEAGEKVRQANASSLKGESPPKIDETGQSKETAPAKVINRLTVENFSRVEDGMTYAQVKRIIGPASEETASSSFGAGTEFAVKTVMLTWKGSWGANCNVTFQNGVVMAKAQFGLPHGGPTPDLPDEEAEQAKAKAAADRDAAQKVAEEIAEADRIRREKEAERKAADEAAKWRTWTDSSGAHKIDAKFSGMTAGKVKLTKRDGTVVTLSIEKLSDDDQEWIKKRSK